MQALHVFADQPPQVVTLPLPHDIPDNHVLVAVHHAAINYKDALCVTGKGKIAKEFPHIPGIDFSGRVIKSRHTKFTEGDMVLASNSPLGEQFSGGYAEYTIVPGDWLIQIPHTITARDAVLLGTAGFTAVLCAKKIEEKVIAGTIVVSGASGGVGGFVTTLLSHRGYKVAAITTEKKQDYGSNSATEIR